MNAYVRLSLRWAGPAWDGMWRSIPPLPAPQSRCPCVSCPHHPWCTTQEDHHKVHTFTGSEFIIHNLMYNRPFPHTVKGISSLLMTSVGLAVKRDVMPRVKYCGLWGISMFSVNCCILSVYAMSTRRKSLEVALCEESIGASCTQIGQSATKFQCATTTPFLLFSRDSARAGYKQERSYNAW